MKLLWRHAKTIDKPRISKDKIDIQVESWAAQHENIWNAVVHNDANAHI